MKYRLKFFSFFFFLALVLWKVTICEVKFVFEMFRHGARSPTFMKNESFFDIYDEQWSGSGELTPIGMRQQYLLGRRAREKYSNLISQSYDPKEILIYATNVNRTLMSAYSHLQGIFSPSSGPTITQDRINLAIPPVRITPKLNEDINLLGASALPNLMQVAPIHILDDKRFNLHKIEVCPGVAPIRLANENKKVFKDFVSNFNSTWTSQLKQVFDVSDPNYFSARNIDYLFDSFVCDYTEGKNLSELQNAGIKLSDFNRTAFEFLTIDMLDLIFGDKDSIVAKLSMSSTALDIISWMDLAIEKDKLGRSYLGYKTPKMVIYSAHDDHMAAVQVFLKSLFNLTSLYYVPYASSILIELNKRGNSTLSDYYSVVVNFNDIILLDTDYESFKSTILKGSLKQDQIAKLCGWTDWQQSATIYWNFTIVLALISVLLICILIYYCTTKSKRNESEYNRLSQQDSVL